LEKKKLITCRHRIVPQDTQLSIIAGFDNALLLHIYSTKMASAEKGEDPPQQLPPYSPSQSQRADSAMPKRKPLPAAAEPVEQSAAVVSPEIKPAGAPVITDDEKGPQLEWEAATTEPSYFTQGRRRGVKFALPAFASSFSGLRRNFDARMPFANDRRKRKFFIGGIIAGVVIVLSLIIGLAAGLTVGRKCDLPFTPS
jgi:hypothetical protein